nr:hypothetical protein [Tanacetum cinerariifolium]
MDSLSRQVVSAAKLPILNPNEFDLWKIKIEQYFLMTDYSLWEVILNGDSLVPTRVIEGVVQPVAPTTVEQSAKTLMEAIEKRFGGNKETKKRNKIDLEEQSLDNLFNSLKIYEAEVKSSSSASTLTQNIAFVSSNNTDSTNEPVSVVASVFAASAKIPIYALPNVDTLSNARTGRNLGANEPTSMGFDMSKVECYNYHKKGHFARKCSLPASPIYDRYHLGDGYHVVPPPYTGTFMTPKPDLVFHDAPHVNETVHTTFTVELSPTKPEKDLSPTHRPSAPIIEDWVSDSEDDYEAEIPQNTPCFVQPTEQVKTPRPFVKLVENSIQATNNKIAILKPKRHGNRRNRKACFVCMSLTHLIKDYDYYEMKMAQTPARNHAQRGNHQQYARMTLLNPQKHVVPTIVLTKSKIVPITAARPVTTSIPKPHVTRPRPAKTIVTKPYSPPRRNINRSPSLKASTFPLKVTAAKAPMVNSIKGNWGNPQHALKDKGVIDSRCSRHMTGNMSYMSDFEEINGGYFAFGGNPKGGKISGKGKIRTGKLDFDDVYFVKELKFNLFSVLQMYDKKNNVLFTDTECIFLSLEFKLPDENQVLLRVPRENNMYNVDLKNIVPSDLISKFDGKADEGFLVGYSEPEFEGRNHESEVHVSLSSSAQTKKHDDKTKKEAKGKIPTVGQISTNSTNTFSATGPSNTFVSPAHGKSSYVNTSQYPDDPNMLELEDITYSGDEEDVGVEADFTNLETNITVRPIPTTRVHKDHPVTQIIGDLSSATQTRSMTRVAKDQDRLSQINNDDFYTCMFACFLSQEEPKRVHQALKDLSWIEAMHEELLQFNIQKEEGIDCEDVFAPVARIETIRLFLAYASFMGFMVYQMDVKSAFLYGTIEEEVCVCQPLGFEDPDYPDKVYKVVKALYGLHQAPSACMKLWPNIFWKIVFRRER